MSRIFLSHSSTNNAEAIAVRDWMKTHGWDDTFLDLDPERGLKPGERWQDALKRAAERCEMVIFLVSPVWAASKWCLAEFLLAKSLNKRIFALIVEPTAFEVLPVELTAEWQVVDLTVGTRDYSATITLPPHDKTATVTFGSDGLNRLRIGLMQSGIDASHFDWPPANDRNRPPYRGLRPLEADDAGIFFGRDAGVIGALDSLRGLRDAAPPRLLVILGASGAGKSSFLRAGLTPRLARDARNFFVLPIVRPDRVAITGESGLLRALEGAFQVAKIATTRADLRAAVGGGAVTLRPLLQQLADKVTLSDVDAATKPNPASLVLAIDQGEELFLAEGQEEARTFLVLLRDLLIDDAPALIALFTIRSDNYERLQLAKELDGVRQVTLSLPPMPKGAYAEVIKGPAERLDGTPRALKVDDALVEALLTDIEAGGAKDSLPLLAFTLERLYGEFHGGGHLKAEHYKQLGGIAGSIEAAVEQALKLADADPKIPADRQARLALLRRGLIPGVAGIDPDTGAPRRRVARLSEIPAEARPLLDLLVEQRLLSTDVAKDTGEKTIEPAHEALLRQWGLLQGWLKEDSGLLSVMDMVQRASRDWAANRKSTAWLIHTTDRLMATERLLERADLAANLEPSDRDYLAACRAAERAAAEKELAALRTRQRLQKRAAWALLAVGILVTAGLVAGLLQSRATARREAIVLTSLADRAAMEGHHDRAMRIALQGLPPPDFLPWISPWSVELEAKLSGGAMASRLQARFTGHQGAVRSAVFSPDGRRVLTGSEDNTARLWDAERGTEIAILKGHQVAVRAIFSPDGTRILTTGSDVENPDSTARLWDAERGTEIAVLEGHEAAIWSAAFSPDSAQILTSSQDKTARMWDARRGIGMAVLAGHEDTVWSAVFSPDGTRILTASDDKTARLWDAQRGTEIAALKGHAGRVRTAVFSPDGTRIVTAAESDKVARLWDGLRGTELTVLKGHEGSIWIAAFSPDGRRIVTGADNNTGRLWDGERGTEIAVLRGHDSRVDRVVFSPDSTRVLTGSTAKTMRLWDAQRGTEVAILGGHDDSVWSAVFSQDSTRILTGSDDNTVRLWDGHHGREVAILRHEGSVWSALFSHDGTRILTASGDKTARLWDGRRDTEIAVLKGHAGNVTSAVFSPDGTRILTSSQDKTVRLWDVRRGTEVATLKGHEAPVTHAVFSPDGTRILTTARNPGFRDMTARLWDGQRGTEIAVLKESLVNTAVFSPDGTRILTASGNKTARLWDGRRGTEIALLKGHERSVLSAVFSPDGLRILTASGDKTARLWDRHGTQVGVLEGHEGPVRHAVFSPDGTRILTAAANLDSAEKTARLWDAQRGTVIAVLRGHAGELTSAVFSPDGKRILTGSWDKTARLWDGWLGTEIAVLQGHDSRVSSAVFSPDGARVVTAGDNTARLWDGRRGTAIAVLKVYAGGVANAVFSPDGSRILTGSGDGTARLWDATWALMRGQELRERACREKLVGAPVFTLEEARDPILAGLAGTNPCERHGSLSVKYWADLAHASWSWIAAKAMQYFKFR